MPPRQRGRRKLGPRATVTFYKGEDKEKEKEDKPEEEQPREEEQVDNPVVVQIESDKSGEEQVDNGDVQVVQVDKPGEEQPGEEEVDKPREEHKPEEPRAQRKKPVAEQVDVVQVCNYFPWTLQLAISNLMACFVMVVFSGWCIPHIENDTQRNINWLQYLWNINNKYPYMQTYYMTQDITFLNIILNFFSIMSIYIHV